MEAIQLENEKWVTKRNKLDQAYFKLICDRLSKNTAARYKALFEGVWGS